MYECGKDEVIYNGRCIKDCPDGYVDDYGYCNKNCKKVDVLDGKKCRPECSNAN